MKYSNAGIFRRYARAEDAMVRYSMPKTDAVEIAALSDPRVREVIAGRSGSRLVRIVPVLSVSIAERMVANG